MWLISVLTHLLVFATALWFAGDAGLAVVVLLPEVVSFALHLLGLRLAWHAAQ